MHFGEQPSAAFVRTSTNQQTFTEDGIEISLCHIRL